MEEEGVFRKTLYYQEQKAEGPWAQTAEESSKTSGNEKLLDFTAPVHILENIRADFLLDIPRFFCVLLAETVICSNEFDISLSIK